MWVHKIARLLNLILAAARCLDYFWLFLLFIFFLGAVTERGSWSFCIWYTYIPNYYQTTTISLLYNWKIIRGLTWKKAETRVKYSLFPFPNLVVKPLFFLFLFFFPKGPTNKNTESPPLRYRVNQTCFKSSKRSKPTDSVYWKLE